MDFSRNNSLKLKEINLIIHKFIMVFTITSVSALPLLPTIQKTAENLNGSYSSAIMFQFLTNIQTTEKLHNQHYHIVNVSLSGKGPFIMHLKKSEFFSEAYEDSDELSNLKCVYSGPIISPNGSSVGMASLSSCRYENSFEGFLLIGNDNFYISPFTIVKPQRVKREVNGHILLEKKQRTLQTYKHTRAKKSTRFALKLARKDKVQIPADKLKKARRQMISDQEGLQDEDAEDENNGDTLFDQNGMSGEDMSKLENLIEPLAGKGQVNTRNRNRNRNKVVRKRTQVKRVIELALYTDQAFYTKWKAKYPSNTNLKINQYLLTLVNNMNHLYQQPSLQPKLSFRLVAVNIQTVTPPDLKATRRSDKYLVSFCNFQGRRDKNGQFWDHAMMITGLDMQDETGSSSTIGLAYTSAMCLRYWSCSLIEFTNGFETAFTGTHEIGHSLGMDHDGESLNKNCAREKFIMAAAADKGQVKWSKCSVANLKNFLASGDPRPRANEPQSVPRCLTKRGIKKSQINFGNGAPGKRFTLQGQCQTVCQGCTPVVDAPYNNICYMLYCRDKNNEIVEAHPALEGTRCNGQKSCRSGVCQ